MFRRCCQAQISSRCTQRKVSKLSVSQCRRLFSGKDFHSLTYIYRHQNRVKKIKEYFLLSISCKDSKNAKVGAEMKQSKMLQAQQSPILGQLLDLISPAKINRFEPKFESYGQWDMANAKASMVAVEIGTIKFMVKNPTMRWILFPVFRIA